VKQKNLGCSSEFLLKSNKEKSHFLAKCKQNSHETFTSQDRPRKAEKKDRRPKELIPGSSQKSVGL
jgi:hypothetical protein